MKYQTKNNVRYKVITNIEMRNLINTIRKENPGLNIKDLTSKINDEFKKFDRFFLYEAQVEEVLSSEN